MDSLVGSGDSDDLWDKINQVVSNDDVSSDPMELQEMMRMVVEKAEFHYNNKKSGEDNVSDPTGSNSGEINKNSKKVTFDLTDQPDKKFAPYVSLQERAAAGSIAAKEPKSVMRKSKDVPTETNAISSGVKQMQMNPLPVQVDNLSQHLPPQLQLQQQMIGESEQLPAPVPPLKGGFEEEAKALQEELSKMQQQLSQRMARYNQLNEFKFTSQADSVKIPSLPES